MKDKVKYALVVLLFGLLFLPLLQLTLGLVTESPLSGLTQDFQKPKLSIANWSSGNFQDSLNNYLNQNCGFHNFLIRLNNQYYYSSYHTAVANKVIVGQDNFLYDQQHINAYTGADFLGDSLLRRRMVMMRDLRDYLAKKNVKLLFVLVPGKATGAPEHLPIGTPTPGVTNYQVTKRLADSLGIPALDFIAWYQREKATSPYPLYPSGGIHWSTYCSTLAADSLLGYVAAATATPLSRFKIERVNMSPGPVGEDGDINAGMNLLFPLPTTPMAYPEIRWLPQPPKLRVLTVADSYYFHPYSDFTNHAFASSHYWFYFRELYKMHDPKAYLNAEIDFAKEMLEQDVVMLYVSDAHLVDFSWGFLDAAMNYFRGPLPPSEILRVSNEIKADSSWYAQIQAKAANEHLPVDSMLKRDAIWVLEMNRGN
jgi:SGNH hydrolase-like domain, acetyltransferase AlgX